MLEIGALTLLIMAKTNGSSSEGHRIILRGLLIVLIILVSFPARANGSEDDPLVFHHGAGSTASWLRYETAKEKVGSVALWQEANPNGIVITTTVNDVETPMMFDFQTEGFPQVAGLDIFVRMCRHHGVESALVTGDVECPTHLRNEAIKILTRRAVGH